MPDFIFCPVLLIFFFFNHSAPAIRCKQIMSNNALFQAGGMAVCTLSLSHLKSTTGLNQVRV